MLRRVPGKRIRMQFFNMFTVGNTVVVLAILLLALIKMLLGEETPPEEWVDALITSAVILAPWYLLTVLNWFFFGRIVCVLNEEGIFYMEDRQVQRIAWEDVTRLCYNPPTRGHWCNVEVWDGSALLAAIPHAPYGMMHRARRFKKIKVGLPLFIWILAAVIGVILLVLALWMSLKSNI